jgi:hypothetical protein
MKLLAAILRYFLKSLLGKCGRTAQYRDLETDFTIVTGHGSVKIEKLLS